MTLPGSDMEPIEVGAGSWHWSVPYQDPDARGPLTVDDTVGEIIIDDDARDAVFEVLDRVGVSGFLKANLYRERSISLRQVLHMLPNYEEALDIMNATLENL